MVNGRVSRAAAVAEDALGPHWAGYAERNQVFAGNSSGAFRDISPDIPALCGRPNVARGLACGDIDGDGALDLLVTTAAGPARLYRNVAPRRGHWLSVRAVDPCLHRDAYGAVVRLHAGGRTWHGLMNPAGSYLCSSDARAHFGLGAADRVDRIEVLWPDGTSEAFAGSPADCAITLRKGESLPK